MKVIVAGFPKTGTKSLNAALRLLGYNVYDYLENTIYLRDEWMKILKKGWTTEDFRKMYENVDASTDIPACYFWEEMHKAFPEAKIILMLRDEDSWVKSLENQIYMNETTLWFLIMPLLSPTFKRTLWDIYALLSPIVYGFPILPAWKQFFVKTKLNKELMKMKFRAHNAHVLQNAPADKLLLYKCSEGWEPLCKFLEVPIPKEEFPHMNKKGQLLQKALKTSPFLKKMQREVITSFVLIATTASIGGYFLYTRGPVNLVKSGVEVITDKLNWFR